MEVGMVEVVFEYQGGGMGIIKEGTESNNRGICCEAIILGQMSV